MKYLIISLVLTFSSPLFSKNNEKYNYFVQDMNNNIVSIKEIFTRDIKEEVRALVFFQTTCLPCIAEHKLIQKILNNV